MTRYSIGRGILFLVVAFLMASCAMMPGDGNVRLRGTLSGASQNPPVSTTGAGTVEATLNKNTNLLKWRVNYSGLSGPARAGHFHGPAVPGQNTGVVLGFTGSIESPFQGEATLTAAQAADVLASKWYVNLHTAQNPGGEIRAHAPVSRYVKGFVVFIPNTFCFV